MNNNLSVQTIDAHTWSLDEGMVRFFLLEGEETSLLIDSGCNTHNALDIARKLTEKPVKLLNTHGDPDHIGSNTQFQAPYMNPSELPNYHAHTGGKGEITPVWDGEILDLGNRPLKIIALPGHTSGSIAILDAKNRRIFTGDSIQDGHVFMFGPDRNFTGYRHGLLRLKTMTDQFDHIHPNHGSLTLTPDWIDKMLDGADAVLEGRANYVPGDMMGTEISIFKTPHNAFLCPKKE